MDNEEQKICPNCKREIPAVNFMIHTVHCARNIRMCPVCKEPVPQADLQLHHDKLHKLLPCKQCGESVCGTDLEDHIRDSCGNTIKSCRFCELELPRRSLPAHEGYCGARTEQCAECREWVMLKYRQLHLDSNHGFLRLDDDPEPTKPKKDPPKSTNTKVTNIPTPTHQASTSNGIAPTLKTTNEDRPKTIIRYLNTDIPTTSAGSISDDSMQENRSGGASNTPSVLNGSNVQKAPLKRNNDQPQVNRYSWLASSNKVIKDLPGRGAVKKRPAPKPPTSDPKRELAYFSALQRHQQEEKKRQEQNAYNLARGLPPVLSPAAKLEKLRKMDALHNRETEEVDYREQLRGRVWMDQVNVPTGNILGHLNSEDEHRIQNDQNLAADHGRITGPEAASSARNPEETHDFRNLKPMTPQEFMDRFNKMQLKKEPKRDGERECSAERRERNESPLWLTGGSNVDRNADRDRFNDIKSSLRELRRGLNEVIAPYNAANASVANVPNSQDGMRRSPGPVSPTPGDADDEVVLPCEFCGAPVPADDLVQHQTGCRPDLTQYRPGSPSPASPPPAPRPRPRPPPEVPVIPCEFCAQSLPVYLISEHQERCERESNPLLYPD